MSEQLVAVSLTINGQTVQRLIEPRLSLVDFLRHEVELTGTHVGCEMGLCGACLVLLDGEAVHSCLMFAVQADGLRIETIEGLAERGAIAELQAAFLERNALQCGFCTPGMILTAVALLYENPNPTPDEIRRYLEGNLCRCTGYGKIIEAIQAATGYYSGIEEEEPTTTRVRRLDAPEKTTGLATYGADLKRPGMLFGKILHSRVPHAWIKGKIGLRQFHLRGLLKAGWKPSDLS